MSQWPNDNPAVSENISIPHLSIEEAVCVENVQRDVQTIGNELIKSAPVPLYDNPAIGDECCIGAGVSLGATSSKRVKVIHEPLVHTMVQNLRELISLHESCESVTWPKGYDYGMAKRFVDYMECDELNFDVSTTSAKNIERVMVYFKSC